VTAGNATLETLGRELVEPLIAECEKVRAEGVVANADLVDAGVIFGTGFAPFRGGPLHFKANETKSNVMPFPTAQTAAQAAE
jgi:3-hydroxyacyl-CoA dehydrogenase / enoyl-CoA hydratase / 3-hydroxybutyryl-CoA epimerase